MNSLSRRGFISASALAAGTAALARAVPGDRSIAPPPILRGSGDDGFGNAKRVIFAVADGMSMGTLTLADLYSKTVYGRDLFWPQLMMRQGARNALCCTQSADSLVTDSAAASTTWSCGTRVNNKAIGYTPDGDTPRPILMRVNDAGFRSGLVTTARVTDATPAGWIANVPLRTMEQEIAQQVIDRAPNIVLGGGREYFGASVTRNYTGHFTTNHRAVGDVRQTRSVVGIFSEGHIPYHLDRSDDDADLLSMTKDAIEHLDYLKGGYLVQVEGARVDHAGHNNDAVSMIHEMIEFDRTLEHLVRYVEGRDDTLLIATTDHGNSNPALTVYTEDARRGLLSLSNARRSFDWIHDELKERDPGMDNMGVQREVIAFATGVALKRSDLELLNPKISKRADLFEEANSMTCRLGSLLANRSGIAFLSKNHTSDMVAFTAYGVGAELFPPVMQNTDIMPRMMHTMGIDRMSEIPQRMVRA